MKTRIVSRLTTPTAIYGLIGAVMGLICAGLTDPSGDSSPHLYENSSGRWGVSLDAHVSYAVYFCGAVVGFCAGVGYRAFRSYLKRRGQAAAGGSSSPAPADVSVSVSSFFDKARSEPKRLYPTALFAVVSLVFGYLCYKTCTEPLLSWNDPDSHTIRCATILHHRKAVRTVEQATGQGGELTKTSWLALGYFTIFAAGGAVSMYQFNRAKRRWYENAA